MTAYADVRKSLASTIAAAVGGTWIVAAQPLDRIGDQAVLISPQDDDPINGCRWRRTMGVGLFVRRAVLEESFDLFDQTVPTVRDALEDRGDVTVQGGSTQGQIDLGGTEFLFYLLVITIETTPEEVIP